MLIRAVAGPCRSGEFLGEGDAAGSCSSQDQRRSGPPVFVGLSWKVNTWVLGKTRRCSGQDGVRLAKSHGSVANSDRRASRGGCSRDAHRRRRWRAASRAERERFVRQIRVGGVRVPRPRVPATRPRSRANEACGRSRRAPGVRGWSDPPGRRAVARFGVQMFERRILRRVRGPLRR